MANILDEEQCELIKKNLVMSKELSGGDVQSWSDSVIFDLLDTIGFLRAKATELEAYVVELGRENEKVSVLDGQINAMEEKLLDLGYECLYVRGRVEFKNLNE